MVEWDKEKFFPWQKQIMLAQAWHTWKDTEDGGLTVNVIMIDMLTTDKKDLHKPVSIRHEGENIHHELAPSSDVRSNW